VDSIAPWIRCPARFHRRLGKDYFTRLATNSSVAKFATFRVNFVSSPQNFPTVFNAPLLVLKGNILSLRKKCHLP